VDTAGPLASIARTLPGLPPEAIESMLLTFDTLVTLSDQGQRPGAAQFLRDAAALCQDAACSERLLRAANAVAAGEPCALTPQGLTWKQAAAAQTISMEEWKARPDLQDEAVVSGQGEDTGWQAEGLPHLRVQHFFPGLTVRVRREFADSNGRLAAAGEILHLLNAEHSAGGHTLACMERTLRLSTGTPDFTRSWRMRGMGGSSRCRRWIGLRICGTSLRTGFARQRISTRTTNSWSRFAKTWKKARHG
jgi:hypothetical protein